MLPEPLYTGTSCWPQSPIYYLFISGLGCDVQWKTTFHTRDEETQEEPLELWQAFSIPSPLHSPNPPALSSAEVSVRQ